MCDFKKYFYGKIEKAQLFRRFSGKPCFLRFLFSYYFFTQRVATKQGTPCSYRKPAPFVSS